MADCKARLFFALLALGAGGSALLAQNATGRYEASRRGAPRPVRSYAELERETGLTTPAALAYARMAFDIGAKQWPTTVSFRCHATDGHVYTGLTAPPATRVFDNVYYVGDAEVSAWAITTSEGIILLDSLGDEASARRFVEGGLRSVGLDPARIRYILLTHEHYDHYGGAAYLRRVSGARVAMSETAWQAIERDAVPPAPGAPPVPGNTSKPARDMVLRDGQRVTLGDTTVTVVATPGHTPGTVSFIFPVRADRETHMAALWAGNSLPASTADRRIFLASVDHFAAQTSAARVDVELSVHEDADDLIARLAQRRRGGPNPFIVGREAYLRYEEIYRLCTRARMAEQEQLPE